MGNWKDSRMVARYAKFSDEAFREAASKMASITTGERLSECITVAPESGGAAAEG